MTKLMWRVKLVAERHPGIVTETELAYFERDEAVGLADLGLRLDEAKRLTASLQVEMVPAQMAALGQCPRACEACGRKLVAKEHWKPCRRTLSKPPTSLRCRRRTRLWLGWTAATCVTGAGTRNAVGTMQSFGG